jgi:hypothetical protein
MIEMLSPIFLKMNDEIYSEFTHLMLLGLYTTILFLNNSIKYDIKVTSLLCGSSTPLDVMVISKFFWNQVNPFLPQIIMDVLAFSFIWN